MNYETFFMKQVPDMLKGLTPESKGLWGSLSASEMLDHLRRGLDLSISDTIEVKVLTPSEHIPKYKAFLMSDKPFRKDAGKPQEYELTEAFEGDLNDLKVNLMKSVVRMQVYMENNPDHQKNHPDFGPLSGTEWLHLHKKHFIHHFTQFQLISKTEE
jgi:oxepin-CoA hydrolase/3-oxo-5,6-dehydrosuberyl-CoA semialdehyde dehydrogenase